MVIFLYGEDSFRSKQKLNEVINHYKSAKKSGLSLIYFDASKKVFSDFYNQLNITSMFQEKKLAILTGVFSDKSFQESFLEKLKEFEELKDVIMVYESEEIDQRLKLFKSLIKNCKYQEFESLSGQKLKNWALKEFEKLEQKINLDALDMLVSFTGNDLWRISNEIQKLATFKLGSTIKKEDIILHVKPKIEMDIFKTIDALAVKNKKQALFFLQKHINEGDNPLYLLSMIAFQFRNLLVVKELAQKGLMYATIVKKSGLHPFVVKKNYFACSQFSFDDLKRIYKEIYKIDCDIKSGFMEAETALDLLVAKI